MPTRRAASRVLLAVCGVALAGVAWQRGEPPSCWSAGSVAFGRRGALATAAATASLVVGAEDSEAFPNGLSKKKRDINDPKRPGMMPSDLGLLERFGFEDKCLKECDNPPNCFSTSVKEGLDDGIHAIEPWKYTGKSPEDAMKEIKATIQAYPPGYQNIDGGGFDVKAEGPDFVYVQFESLKRGYLDDVEFVIAPGAKEGSKDGSVLLRSASRQGFYDYGANALRLNKLATDLKARGGWTVGMIDEKSHPRYWKANCIKDDVKAKFPKECAEYMDIMDPNARA